MKIISTLHWLFNFSKKKKVLQENTLYVYVAIRSDFYIRLISIRFDFYFYLCFPFHGTGNVFFVTYFSWSILCSEIITICTIHVLVLFCTYFTYHPYYSCTYTVVHFNLLTICALLVLILFCIVIYLKSVVLVLILSCTYFISHLYYSCTSIILFFNLLTICTILVL